MDDLSKLFAAELKRMHAQILEGMHMLNEDSVNYAYENCANIVAESKFWRDNV